MESAARRITPIPMLEWRSGDGDLKDFLDEAVFAAPDIARVELAYHQGRFDEAIAAAGVVLAGEDPLESMVALCLKLNAHVCLGDGSTAYAVLVQAREACHRYLKDPADAPYFDLGFTCARIVEATAAMHLFDLDDASRNLDVLPVGWQIYGGYQMAANAYSEGKLLRCMGMARSFLALAGGRCPIPCIKLNLLSACTSLRLNDVDAARESWWRAWEIACDFGLVAPFIELNPYMPGLTRACLKDVDGASYSKLHAMVRARRTGRAGLRRALKASQPFEALSVLEHHVAILVAWGWSNREVARFLDIAENTVKHYLTSVYQKLGITGRSELPDYLLAHPGSVPGLLLRAAT